MQALGDFIGGRFLSPEGDELVSSNPAKDGATVLATRASAERATQAAAAAGEAHAGWQARSFAERLAIMRRFGAELAAREDQLAEAIRLETGKLASEARTEARSLPGRIESVAAQIERDMAEQIVAPGGAERLRYHAHGVVAVIGPFNFPLHLCHAHVAPALLLGNAVVMKPSEVTPLSGQRYAEAALAAGLPAGVLNVVQGRGDAGAALLEHEAVRALAFTGSYETGHRIKQAALGRPELLLALEMGGKNTVVVCDDADLRQAVHEIVVGGTLTTGQRCTCTDRVLVHESVRDRLVEALRPVLGSLRFGDPEAAGSFAGPMTTAASRQRYRRALDTAEAAGARAVLRGEGAGEYYEQASLHVLPDGVHDIPGYTDTELFGPGLGVEVVGSDAEAMHVLNASPFGLATSVFSRDRERFERFYEGTLSGILNLNRSTNQASPRLPFGGVGKSGNQRPAGSFAPRNLAVPVALQENQPGVVTAHPMLARQLPALDLDRLEEQHAAEEAEEARRDLVSHPRPKSPSLPRGGALPRSEALLERLYAGARVPRERKPPVFDHLRSSGPWLVSVDEQPLAVMDGMSQTSTLVAGFAPDAVVRTYVEGGFGEHLVRAEDTTVTRTAAWDEYAAALREAAPGFEHVTFTNSGAEANEKALALCRLHHEGTRVLAFEGSFHGRTLLALHATWSPKKRIPFEIEGMAASFAPFPVWDDPTGEAPPAPDGFLDAVKAGDIRGLVREHADSDDALLRFELASLEAVHGALGGGDHFACIVEPMQSEGGDRYGTPRFFQALRLLTRHHGVPLVFDEVQTGFGLGGPVLWHEQFELTEPPDVVTIAKRAQLGVVLSRFEDPEPTSVSPVSLIRGRVHLELASDDAHARATEAEVLPRLQELQRRYPHLVESARGQGHAFAFELPSPTHLAAFIGQRFWRGAVVFAAGERTVRYRLSQAYGPEEIDRLFEVIRRSLSYLDAHPSAPAPSWEDPPAAGTAAPEHRPTVRVRVAEASEENDLLEQIVALEQNVYELARQDPPEQLRLAFAERGVAVVGEVETETGWVLGGYALGAPLEKISHKEGPDRDPMLGRGNTLYSIAITVDPRFQGLGLGRELKRVQMMAARELGYQHVSGRNRVGHADAMAYLNRTLGSYEIFRLTGQYGDPDGEAIYYRMPVGVFVPDAGDRAPTERPAMDLASGISMPVRDVPSLRQAESRGLLYGPAVNKITLMNYVTPAYVRAVEWISALLPEHPHMYMTSGRDETCEKAVRTLRFHRAQGMVALSLEGGYFGHTTATARSLSDASVHRQGPGNFDWPRLPHPAEAGADATLAAIRDAVKAAGGERPRSRSVRRARAGTHGTRDPRGLLAAPRRDAGVPGRAPGAERDGDGLLPVGHWRVRDARPAHRPRRGPLVGRRSGGLRPRHGALLRARSSHHGEHVGR